MYDPKPSLLNRRWQWEVNSQGGEEEAEMGVCLQRLGREMARQKKRSGHREMGADGKMGMCRTRERYERAERQLRFSRRDITGRNDVTIEYDSERQIVARIEKN